MTTTSPTARATAHDEADAELASAITGIYRGGLDELARRCAG